MNLSIIVHQSFIGRLAPYRARSPSAREHAGERVRGGVRSICRPASCCFLLTPTKGSQYPDSFTASNAPSSQYPDNLAGWVVLLKVAAGSNRTYARLLFRVIRRSRSIIARINRFALRSLCSVVRSSRADDCSNRREEGRTRHLQAYLFSVVVY